MLMVMTMVVMAHAPFLALGMADFQYVPPSEVVVKEQRGAFQLVSQGTRGPPATTRHDTTHTAHMRIVLALWSD